MNIIKGLPAFSIVASCNDYIEDVDVAIACILGRGIKKTSRGNFYSQREKRGLREHTLLLVGFAGMLIYHTT